MSETKNDLQKPANALQEKLMADVLKAERQLTESIINTTSDIRTKLPEEVFISNFLPYFSGQAPITENSSILASWISIARTPMSEVDIIDKAGETLFTVPPIFDTSVINVSKNLDGRSLLDIQKDYNLYLGHVRSIADKRLSDSLTNKSEEILQESDKLSENKKRWVEIFQKYNVNIENKTIDNSEIVNNEPNDDVIYD